MTDNMTRDIVAVILMMNFFSISLACAAAADRSHISIWAILGFAVLAAVVPFSWSVAAAIVGKP